MSCSRRSALRVISVGAVLFGLILAVVIIGFRTNQGAPDPDEDAQTQPLGLTPTSINSRRPFRARPAKLRGRGPPVRERLSFPERIT